jgi:septal ring factor EnvC (AmiA/AmiB activator)
MDTDDNGGTHCRGHIQRSTGNTENAVSPIRPAAEVFPRSQLRTEIFEVKRSINRIEREIDAIKIEISALQTEKGDFKARAKADPVFWERFDNTARLIQTLSEQLLENDKQIARDKERLVWLEMKLANAEEAAAERAKGMLAYQLPTYCK